ncbi:MAG: cadherin-like beta sandwich domain-containing protein [Myxococcota bacterium]
MLRFALHLACLSLLAVACGSTQAPCGPTTCPGCCATDGACVAAPTAQACGAAGAACVMCTGGARCVAGACAVPDGGLGGDGGAMGPCDVGNGGCDAVATCTPSGSSVTCTCPAGSEGDGLTCTPRLSSLTISPASLSPLFSPAQTTYAASVPYASTLITVTAATKAAGATILIDGQPTTTRMIPLSAPTRPVAVTVRFDATQRSTPYSLTVARARRTVEQGVLAQPTPVMGDALGSSAALSRDGNTLVVGAPGDDATGGAVMNGGAAFVFQRVAGTWRLVQTLRASNAGALDAFGSSVAISAHGAVIAIGAPKEDSDGAGDNEAAADSGAVYVFRASAGAWTEEARLKATLVGAGDGFGASVAVSGDGQVIAAGGPDEDGGLPGIDNDASDDTAPSAGAVWIFRHGTAWAQEAYVKASNPDARDRFGVAVALNDDGSVVAVGATGESSAATTIDGLPDDDSALNAGAVYVFRKATTWAQLVRLKASNAGAGDVLGASVAISGDGKTVVAGAWGEDSGRVGVDGPDDDTADLAGAAYVFVEAASGWQQAARLKASNADSGDRFGQSVSVSRDGQSVVVGAPGEASSAMGLDGDQALNNLLAAGAAYLFGKTSAGWVQEVYAKASTPAVGDGFGSTVTLAGDGVSFTCGAPGAASGAGAAYAFTRLPF